MEKILLEITDHKYGVSYLGLCNFVCGREFMKMLALG